MVNYYGCIDPSQGRGVLDGSAYKDGMEYEVWRDADGWTLGACHEDVGLMTYWTGEKRESLLDFAGIRDEYVETLNQGTNRHREERTMHYQNTQTGERVTEDELWDRYRDALDELGDVTIGGLQYRQSVALERVDPIAFGVGFNDWADAEEWEEV